MTREEFRRLPHLVQEGDVQRMGYSARTVAKFVECGVLARVQPKGTGSARYQKRQLAQLLGWEELLEGKAFEQEPPLLPTKAVHRWTGFSENTLAKTADAGALRRVQPPGASTAKYLKADVAAMIGFEQFV